MKFFTFGKGNALTFLCLKEKLQKKQTSLLLDLLASMEALSTKARSLIAKAYLKVHVSLDERNFAARRFFEEL